jgi:Ca-activated chloride channel homolog
MTTPAAPLAVWSRAKSRTRDQSQALGHFVKLSSSSLVLFLITLLTSPVHAEVFLRIAEPLSDPVTIRAEVTDENGGQVTDLHADDFTVRVNGNPPPSQLKFEQPAKDDPSQRTSVIFVMDYSESVANSFETPMVASTQSFIDAMQIGDFAGVLKFSAKDGMVLVAPLREITGDTVRSELKNKAREDPAIPRDAGTALLDGIKHALDEFQDNLDTLPPGRKAVILISDGNDKDSTSNRGQLKDLAKALGVAIFSVGVGNVTDPIPNRDPPQTGEDLLQSLADITGGTYQFAPNDAGIQQIYDEVSDSLLNEYLLTFDYGVAVCQEYKIQVAAEPHGQAEQTVSASCPPRPLASSTSAGGGGVFGFLGLIAGVSLLALRRRLRAN